MSISRMCRLGVLLSGRGSNFAAIQQAIESGRLKNAQIAVVLSNHADAVGLQVARDAGLETITLAKEDYASRVDFDAAIVAHLQARQVELVILAGYDRIVGAPLLQAYPQRILNIHPSLLPAYGGKGMVGLRVHQSVLEQGESESGCSVHIVTEVVDGGAILGQSRVPVMAGDTPESLASRVLAQEHQLYSQVIEHYIEQIRQEDAVF